MPNKAFLTASLALWRRRNTYRQHKLDIAHAQNDVAAIAKWQRLRREAGDMIELRLKQLEDLEGKPKIITSRQLGLTFQNVFGAKGTPTRGTGHYTAGHRCANATALAAEMRNDHAYHKGKGWGGLSYEVMIADDGTLGFGNPMDRKSAAVALNNSTMVNVCCPGTTGDKISAEQERTLKWLWSHWHTSAVPSAYRLPVKASQLAWKGHKEWPSQSTACPGDMLPEYHRIFP